MKKLFNYMLLMVASVAVVSPVRAINDLVDVTSAAQEQTPVVTVEATPVVITPEATSAVTSEPTPIIVVEQTVAPASVETPVVEPVVAPAPVEASVVVQTVAPTAIVAAENIVPTPKVGWMSKEFFMSIPGAFWNGTKSAVSYGLDHKLAVAGSVVGLGLGYGAYRFYNRSAKNAEPKKETEAPKKTEQPETVKADEQKPAGFPYFKVAGLSTAGATLGYFGYAKDCFTKDAVKNGAKNVANAAKNGYNYVADSRLGQYCATFVKEHPVAFKRSLIAAGATLGAVALYKGYKYATHVPTFNIYTVDEIAETIVLGSLFGFVLNKTTFVNCEQNPGYIAGKNQIAYDASTAKDDVITFTRFGKPVAIVTVAATAIRKKEASDRSAFMQEVLQKSPIS